MPFDLLSSNVYAFGMRFFALLCLAVSLTNCAFFQSPRARQEKEYARYVEKSRQNQAQRSAAIRREQANQIPQPAEMAPVASTEVH